MERVGPQPRALQPLPARVLRRPAPAHRHRPGPRPAAEAASSATSRSRRSTCRSRRRSSTCSRTCRTSSGPRLRLHRPRPVRRPAHLRPGRVMYLGKIMEDAPTATTLYEHAAAPLHPRPAVGRARCPTRARSRAASGSCSRATCPARSTRRRAACSAPAAPRRRRSAPTRCRCRSSWRRATGWPATSPRSAQVI